MRAHEELRQQIAAMRGVRDPFQLQKMVDRAEALCGRIPSDTQVDASNYLPPPRGKIIQPTLAPDMWVVGPERPVVAPSEEAAPIIMKMNFAEPTAWLIGVRATAVNLVPGSFAAGDFEQATAGIKIQINGARYNLTTNTDEDDFIVLSDLVTDGVQWSPMMRRVVSSDVLSVTFRNFQPVGTGQDLTCSVAFGVRQRPFPGSSTD